MSQEVGYLRAWDRSGGWWARALSRRIAGKRSACKVLLYIEEQEKKDRYLQCSSARGHGRMMSAAADDGGMSAGRERKDGRYL
jgi:hypothetical protein